MVNLPDQPPAFRRPAQPDLSWWWRLEVASGEQVEVVEEYAAARFPSQADAESWVGEVWPELVEFGVDAVTLFEGERQVYGPMSLHA